MTAVRPDCLPLPKAMLGRPVDLRGYPVPWFAAEISTSVFDFRVVTPERFMQAVRQRRCWVSGEPLGRHMSFVIGPMCTINRISADPPSKRELAVWSARVCPFLTRPLATRSSARDLGFLPDAEGVIPGERGMALARNPGVMAVWTCERAEFLIGERLFQLGDPSEVLWFTRGREATRAEVEAAFERGFPALRDFAEAEGSEALDACLAMREAVRAHLPRVA